MTWLLGLHAVCVHTSLDSLAGNLSVSLGFNFEANQETSCTLQLVIQHCTSAALANVATFIRSSIQTIIQGKHLLIAAVSLPLAHNAQHSTIYCVHRFNIGTAVHI